MKRIALCIFITLCIITLSIVSLFMLRSAGRELYEHIDKCRESYLTQSDTLYDDIASLEDYWGEYYVKASFLTRSSSLDDISCSVARLKPLLIADCDEFLSELNSVRYRVYLLYESQIPHWRSVF